MQLLRILPLICPFSCMSPCLWHCEETVIWFKQGFGVQEVERVVRVKRLKTEREKGGVLDKEIHEESRLMGFIFPPLQLSFLVRCLLKKKREARVSMAVMQHMVEKVEIKVTKAQANLFTYHHHSNFFHLLTTQRQTSVGKADGNVTSSHSECCYIEVSDEPEVTFITLLLLFLLLQYMTTITVNDIEFRIPKKKYIDDDFYDRICFILKIAGCMTATAVNCKCKPSSLG